MATPPISNHWIYRKFQYLISCCSQIVRSRRWYQAHRPKPSADGRKAYAKEVKVKYPLAKITTRP